MAFLGASSASSNRPRSDLQGKIEDQYRGGPAFYIEKGPALEAYAWLFAIVTILASTVFCPGVQSNSIAAAWKKLQHRRDRECGRHHLDSLLRDHRRAQAHRAVHEHHRPFMRRPTSWWRSIIVGINWEQIPAVFSMIISSASVPDSVLGAFSARHLLGVKARHLLERSRPGTGPHASSAAAVSHPAKQGLVQAFSVYIDTLFVCSATGFMVLMTGCYNIADPNGGFIYEGLKGVEAGPVYTQAAIDQVMPGLGGPFIAITIFFFAFTTILGYYYMAETNAATSIEPFASLSSWSC